MKTKGISVVAMVLLALTVGAVPAAAQGGSDLALYMWGTGIDGTVGVGGREADVSRSFSDILKDLQFGGMAAYSHSNGRWAFMADAVIANLGVSGRGEQGVVRADIDVDMTLLEADLGWEASDTFRLFAGARYIDLSNKVELRIGNQVFRGKGSESWVDPLVGFRLSTARAHRLGFWLRGDVGGFGAGSDLAWNASAGVSFRLSDRFSLGLGYRVLDIDYENGSGADRFRYNTQMSGLVAGMAWSW